MSGPAFPTVFSLEREVAVITGGGTGIGLAIASAMAAAGARVVLVGRREAELAAAVAGIGPRATHVVHDVTRLDEAPALIARVVAEVGPVTCLVNNAGIHLKKPAVDTTSEEFEGVLRTHVFSAHALTRAVVPSMIARKGGSILFTASMASLFGIPLVVAYSAAKSAYVGMVRGYATEFSPHGVRVNAIAPGFIETPMTSVVPDRIRERAATLAPLGRVGQPDEVARVALFLASDDSSFVTGQTLNVDGGRTIGLAAF